MGIFFVYLPALVTLGLGIFGLGDVRILRRRGVRTEGRCGGTSWNANIASIDVIYRDKSGERHYVTIAPEDLGLVGDESIVRVVYDPLKPNRATTETILKKSIWKTQEGYLVIVGLCIAAVVTAAIAGSH
ncbi:hypothetical protein ABZT08_26470 [Streptomyces sp. NPDC005526]|uniref:hypothetical protein n=1 Tax=Streptomyces sp. NPDC005526 TaxID=3156885 RepID=UPI0033A34DC1